MKTKLSNLLLLLQAAAAVCTMGAIKLWAPTCSGLLELANGNQTPMKCHYAGQAALGIAVIILAAAVIGLLRKKGGHKGLMAVNAVAAIVLFLVFGSLIGICANAEMSCHGTALWSRGAAILILLASLIEFFTSKEGQIPD